jgi:hypothetical protein
LSWSPFDGKTDENPEVKLGEDVSTGYDDDNGSGLQATGNTNF